MGLGAEVMAVTGFGPREWTWANLRIANGGAATFQVQNSGTYAVSLWMREDGLRIDRLLLTTDTTYIPAEFGPVETERLTDTTTLDYMVDRVIEYDYDDLYRLTSASYSTGEQYAYEYDPVGNRLRQIINGDTTAYLYDAANRLQSVNGETYTFDANGNLLATGVMTNTWDAANRLVNTINSQNSPDSPNSLTPIYNGVGDRVGQTIGLSTTHFALDVQGLPEVIYTSEGNVYLHLPGVIMAESAANEVRYLLSDGLGSVRQVVDESAEVIAYNEFDPYGNPVQSGNVPYGYTGEWWEDEVGLLHLRARWYLPSDGVFLSRDPVESEPPYQYVRGNVVNLTDPSGNAPRCQQDDCLVTQPSYMHEKARISCFDLYSIGGSKPMERYLEKESYSDPAALLTRVAVSENTNNPDDQKLVMWIVRYRMAIAHSEGWRGYADEKRPTDLWTEVSKGGFEAFNIFRHIEEPEKTVREKTVRGNIIAAIYPYDIALDDNGISVNKWLITYSTAQSLLATDLKTGFPQELIVNKDIKNGTVEDSANNFKYAFDSFIANGLPAPNGKYSRQGYSGGNNYYAWNPLRSQWIWPEWNDEWPDWE